MPNKTPWLAPGCRRHAFASLRSKEPVPTFYKCPIWHKMSLAVSLKVLVQTPSSNVSPFQVLNDPNDAFQIVSSRITFGGNGGLCFINSTGNRWRKKTTKLESHMHGLILLYCHTLQSVFLSPNPGVVLSCQQNKEVAAAAHQPRRFVFPVFQAPRCFAWDNGKKSN